jgi:hypothetical protein
MRKFLSLSYFVVKNEGRVMGVMGERRRGEERSGI